VSDKADFDPMQLPSLRRLRAAVQELNANFSSEMLRAGQRFKILPDINSGDGPADLDCGGEVLEDKVSLCALARERDPPKEDQSMTHEQALGWVKQAIRRNRGKELTGNFNPLLIGELFKIQSSPWEKMASDHISLLDDICSSFLEDLLGHCCPEDVHARLWPQIEEQLRARKTAALGELVKLAEDLQMDPINYNHYYIDTVQKRRHERLAKSSLSLVRDVVKCSKNGYSDTEALKLTLDTDLKGIERDMERHSCDEILDCVSAIYKVRPNFAQINLSSEGAMSINIRRETIYVLASHYPSLHSLQASSMYISAH
jgi:hypothetical protein